MTALATMQWGRPQPRSGEGDVSDAEEQRHMAPLATMLGVAMRSSVK